MTLDLGQQKPLVLLGAGKMGGAMLQGWLDHGVPGQDVVIVDPYPAPEILALSEKHGFACLSEMPIGMQAGVLVVAIKPQMFDALLPLFRAHVGEETLVLSVAAGKTLADMKKLLGEAPAIVRGMPNTPAQVARGVTVCCPDDKVTDAQKDLITKLLQAIGTAEWLDDETLMDAVTALSGSGPAYVFHMVEAMAKAGEAAGLAPDLAARLARATVAGGGELLYQSSLPAGTLRENVTSPGGTTAAALAVLMAEPGLTALMTEAVQAARDRSVALSG